MFENKIVQIIANNDNHVELIFNIQWCYAINLDGKLRTICSFKCFEFGKEITEEIIKEAEKQKVNCNRCNKIINHIKKLKI